MPRDPEEERIETDEGVAPAGEVSGGEESFAFGELPDSVFDQKQRQIGQRRKPGGPPLRDDDDLESFGIDGPELPDVPPTEPGEAPRDDDDDNDRGRGRGRRP